MRETTGGRDRGPLRLHSGRRALVGALRLAGSTGGLNSLMSKSNYSNAVLQATVRILCPLVNSTSADVFANTRQLRQFIAGFEVAPGAELQVLSMGLAVDNAEQYRDRLLDLIGEQARNTQRTFGARTVVIEGLNNPISVRQLDDLNVVLRDRWQEATLDDIERRLDASHAGLQRLVQAHSDEELFDGAAYPWTRGSKLGEFCLECGGNHYAWARKTIAAGLPDPADP